MPNNHNNQLSTVLDILRFPMIVLVLFMHVVPISANAIPHEFSWESLYLFTTEFVAHNFGRIAVPIFFLISGYLFFLKAPKQYDSQFFADQWRKRISTLLVPYVLWNLLKYAAIASKGYLMQKAGFSSDGDWGYFQSLDLYHIFYSPLNEPLWYLRDLICMVIISPLFYLLLRYAKHLGMLLLTVWYLSALEIGISGFSLTAIFYFGLGAFYSICRRDMLKDFTRLKVFPLIISVLIISIGTIWDNTGTTKEYWLRPALILGVVGSFALADRLIQTQEGFKNLCLKMAGNVFFIYAVHEIYIKNWLNGFFSRIPMMDHYAVKYVGYFIQPLILLAVSLLLNYLVKRYLPKVYAVLTGGRA